MQMWKLRLELDDRPGRLAAATRALAERDLNVLDLDVHMEPGFVTDELVVASPVPIDAGLLDDVLARVGAQASHIAPGDAHLLVDRVTAWLDETGNLLALGNRAPAALAEVARRLVGADLAWLGAPLCADNGIVARALRTGQPAQAREPVKRIPVPGGAFPWVLAIPVELLGTQHVIALARRAPRFTFTETARIRALARATDRPRPPSERQVDLTDGGSVQLDPLAPTDADALARMHRRCSSRSRHLRYFSPLDELPAHLAARLVEPPGPDHFGVAARIGSEMVGIAHWHRNERRDRHAEMAFIVEDAHQRRGIGTALVHEVARSARLHGVRTLRAVTLSENRAVGPLLRRAGWHASAAFDGELYYEIELDAVPAPA